MRKAPSLLLLVLALAACKASTHDNDGGGGGSGGSGGSGSSAGAGGGMTADQEDTFERGGNQTVAVQQSMVLADALFDFDPTIDASATAATNAQNIGTQVTDNFGSCAKVTVTGATVSIDFGAAPGCTSTNGVSVSGSVAVSVTKSGSTTTIALTFTNLVVGDKSLGGSLSMATTDGSNFTVALKLTSSGTSVTGTVTVKGGSGAFTVDGTITEAASNSSTTIAFTALTYTKGDCYPDGGSIKTTKGKVSETITYDSKTPSTGEVTVTIGKSTTTKTLPAYGTCPHA